MTVDVSDPRYRMSVRIAMVAATFAVVVSALMFYDYSRRPPKDPLEDSTLKTLKAAAAPTAGQRGIETRDPSARSRVAQ